jgi:hypothetical protein
VGQQIEDRSHHLRKRSAVKPALRLAIILGMEEGPSGGIGGKRVSFVRKRGRVLIRRLVAQSLKLKESNRQAERIGGFAISGLDGAVILERREADMQRQLNQRIWTHRGHANIEKLWNPRGWRAP